MTSLSLSCQYNVGKQLKLREEKLDEQLKLVNEHIQSLELAYSEAEAIRLRECEKFKEIEKKEKEVDFLKVTFEKRLKVVEEMEKQVDFDKGSLEKRVKVVEEREKRVDFDRGSLEKRVKAVEEREKQVDFDKGLLEKRLKAVGEREKQFDLDKRSLEKSVIAIEEREIQVEFDEGSLKKRVKQVHLDEELLEKRVKVAEEREKQVDFDKRSLEKRVKAVEETEKQVDFDKGSLEKRVKAAEEREKLVDLDKSSLEKRLKSVEEREKQVQKRVKAVEEREKQTGFDKRSLDKRLKMLEEREKEFDSFQDAKISELVLYEEQLSRKREEFFKSANEKLREGQTLGRGLIKKFELALDVLKGLKLKIDGKFNEMESWEAASCKSLAASVKEAESIRESVEKRFKEFEKMEKEFYSTREEKELELVLKEQELSMERKKLLKEIELKEQAASASFKEAESIRESVEKRFKEFEKIQKEFNSIREEKECELVLKEQKLSMERKELLKEVQLKEQAASASVKEVKSIRESMEKRFKEFEKMEKEFNSTREEKERELVLKEQKLSMERKELLKEVQLKEQDASHKSLAAKEAESIRESMQKQIKEFEKMEKEFNSFREEKERELVLKEQELSIERKELLKGVQLREQQLTEKQSLRDQLLNAAREAFADGEKEVEKRKEEFNLYKEKRLRELVLQEEKFSLMKEEFIREVKFKEMKFNKQEKLVHGLLERLESAQNNVKNLKRTLSERFKEIDLKEVELESVRDWVEREMNDAKDMEDNMEVKENKLEGKKMELQLKEINLGPCAKELEYKEQQLEDLDWMEKNVDSKREFTRTCSNEHLAIKNQVQPERDLVEKHDLHLSKNEQQPDYRLRELNSKEKQNPVHSKELEREEQQLSDTTIGSNIMIEKDESIDLELLVEIEGELLELLIDAPPEKDFELMASEVYELLIESSDPAKIVLDAVKELSSPHFRKREMVSHVGRLCILLLEKVTIISPTIRACVREEAIKLSSEWKSKMKATGQNPVEVLEFLNLLAAYKLANFFDKDELLSFLITVAEHKQTPELCRILGFTENMTGFVQNFIQKKQYLLASIYIYEFKLKHTFPQAAVLNYYLKHSKQLAKIKCNSLEAQDKAIVGEITALKVAIEHITKYGLEFDCSPDILKVQIKKLEFERKRLPQKQGKNGHIRPEDANTRKALEKQLDVIKESGPASKTQRPDKRSSFGSNAQALQMRPKKRPATGHEAGSETNSPQWLTKHVEEEIIIHPRGAYNKRRRKNNLEAPRWNERMSMPSKTSIKHRLS